MKTTKKIILFSSLTLLLLAAALAGAAAYFHAHPEVLAAHAGRYVSDATGLDFQAGRLDWSIRPLRVEAGSVLITSAPERGALKVELPELIGRMRLEGGFGKRTLVVEMIQATGLSVEIGSLDFGAPRDARRPSSRLGPMLQFLAGVFFFREVLIQEISIKEGSIDVRMTGIEAAVEHLEARRLADGRIETGGRVRARLADMDGVPTAAADVRLTVQPGFSFASMEFAGSLEVRNAEIETPRISLGGISASVLGNVDLNSETLTAPSFELEVENLLRLEGRLEAGLDPRPAFDLTIEHCGIDLSEAFRKLPESFPPRSVTVAAEGGLSVSGLIGGASDGDGWIWSGELEVIADENGFSVASDRGGFDGIVSGKTEICFGPDDSPIAVAGDILLKETTFSSGLGGVELGDTSVTFSGRHPDYVLERLSVHVSRAVFNDPGNKPAVEDIRFAGSKLAVNLEDPSVEFSDVKIESPLLGNLSARGRISAEKSTLSVAGEDTGIISLGGMLEVVPSGWEVSGRDTLRVDAVLYPGEDIRFNGKIGLASVEFRDPSGRYIGEGIGSEVDFNGRISLEAASVSGEVSAGSSAGEALIDLFYLDLKRHPFFWSATGVFHTDERYADITRFTFGLENLFDLTADGTVAAGTVPETRISMRLPPAEASPLYEMFVREPFGRRVPLLEGLQVEGRVSAELELTGTPRDFAAKGGFRWHEGRFSAVEEEIHAEDIDILWPVWFETLPGARSSASGSGPLSGSVSVGGLRVSLLPAQPVHFAVEAAANRIRIPEPPVLRLPGGRLEFGPAASEDPYHGDLRVETSIRVIWDDLAPLLSGIWPDPPDGRLEGHLSSVVLEKDRVETAGRLNAEVFGGTVSITDLEASGIFSSTPLLRLSAEFSDIDLGRLTGDTSFGRIEGILNGYIRDLEIAGSQPQRFDMLLETEERSRGGEKISIRAVENISRIGSGQSPFVGLGGVLMSFFETLGYRKIGIRASLSNDFFQVNGTIHEEGVEYLMKRSGISGVNIVNQNPDNRIRFKDMIQRVRRVTAEQE